MSDDFQHQQLLRLQQKIAYRFSDIDLLKQALTHRSFSSVNNERLEFLGDALLSATLSERLYQQFPDAKEGILSRVRSSLVKGDTLADIAREFSLGDYLILGSGELRSGGFRRSSTLADTVEAIIGAVLLDSDIQSCQTMVLHWYESRLSTIVIDSDQLKDSKTRLQEFLQAKKLPCPTYDVIDTMGASHDQTFIVSCQVSLLKEPVTAVASSRRRAEKEAAQKILDLLEVKHNE